MEPYERILLRAIVYSDSHRVRRLAFRTLTILAKRDELTYAAKLIKGRWQLNTRTDAPLQHRLDNMLNAFTEYADGIPLGGVNYVVV